MGLDVDDSDELLKCDEVFFGPAGRVDGDCVVLVFVGALDRLMSLGGSGWDEAESDRKRFPWGATEASVLAAELT